MRPVARASALREAVTVLGPGGRMRVVDGADRYALILHSAGCVDVEGGTLDWRMPFGLRGQPMTFVSARKPAAADSGMPEPGP
jgi:hypothetical protein